MGNVAQEQQDNAWRGCGPTRPLMHPPHFPEPWVQGSSHMHPEKRENKGKRSGIRKTGFQVPSHMPHMILEGVLEPPSARV